MVILPRTAQRKFPDHPNTLLPQQIVLSNHIITMIAGTDHTLFITDTAKENASMAQGHTTNLNAAEAPTTTGYTHPTSYPATKAAHNTHLLKDILGDTLTRTPHTGAATTQPQYDTLHAGTTLMTTLQTKASLVQTLL